MRDMGFSLRTFQVGYPRAVEGLVCFKRCICFQNSQFFLFEALWAMESARFSRVFVGSSHRRSVLREVSASVMVQGRQNVHALRQAVAKGV